MLSRSWVPVLLLLLFMLSQVQCHSTVPAIVHAVTGPVSQYCPCYCSCCHRSSVPVLLVILFMLPQVQCPSTVSATVHVTGPASQQCYWYCSCCHRSGVPVLLLLLFMLLQVRCPSTGCPPRPWFDSPRNTWRNLMTQTTISCSKNQTDCRSYDRKLSDWS